MEFAEGHTPNNMVSSNNGCTWPVGPWDRPTKNDNSLHSSAKNQKIVCHQGADQAKIQTLAWNAKGMHVDRCQGASP